MSLLEEQAHEIRTVLTSYERGTIAFDEYQRQLRDVSDRYEQIIEADYEARTKYLAIGMSFCIVMIVLIALGLLLFAKGIIG